MLFTDASLSGHIALSEVKASRRRRDRRLRHLLAPRKLVHEDGDRDRNAFIQQFDVLLGRSDLITSGGPGPTGMDKAQTLVNVSVTRTPADACATHQELCPRSPALKAARHDVQFLTGTDPRSFVALHDICSVMVSPRCPPAMSLTWWRLTSRTANLRHPVIVAMVPSQIV